MFKRAMRVMMVGLVAMLGFKAEAHYVVVNGQVKYCSVCVHAQLEEDKGNPVDLITHTEKVQFCLKTKEVEILCSNGTVVQSTENVTLVVQKLIDQGDTIEVEGIFSDEALLKALLANTNFCPGLSLPSHVLIRAAKVEIKTYACNLDPTLECEQVKFVELDCKLPKNKFNVINLPPFGTSYDCL